MIEQIRRDYLMQEMERRLDEKLKPLEDGIVMLIKIMSELRLR
jgi:hypothetical protein